LRVEPTDKVLEIGPGPGALTVFLREAGPERLVLVEKDRYWARERRMNGRGALEVVVADAMTLAWERFSEPWKFIGNLPYNVASPLMWDLFSKAGGFSRAVFMVQKEVGLRLTARPGTAAYGALSVWTQSFVRPALEFVVPPHVFRPAPKVDSAVVSFEPPALDGAATEAVLFEADGLARVLKACFQKRRKQLGTTMRAAGLDPERLSGLGIDPKCRPEELPPALFHRLAGARIFSGKH
jgi:16S rRNA (adenine1518-N6/adenine1519-N6)-dimethyltransferase